MGLCQISAQAKAVNYASSLTPIGGTKQADATWLVDLWTGRIPVAGLSTLYPGKTSYSTDILNIPLFMEGTSYFDAASSWYKNGLPPNTATTPPTSNGGIAPPDYLGNGKDFLDSYFRSGIQSGGSGTAAPSGSSDNSANGQILQKSSAYWVAATHVHYNLDMADKHIAANRTADAKANLDSAAAAYYGCGDTNPVPLPAYKGTQITYPTTLPSGDTDTGSNATTMSIYGVANKRASNYNTAKAVPGVASATSPCTSSASPCTKSVAQLNIDVGQALNAATPTAATVQTIRDATNTIFAQAAQRYIAKITLASHLPGNGMGGSTNVDTAITSPADNPDTGYWASGAWGIWNQGKDSGKQSTACGGLSTQMPQLVNTDPTKAASPDQTSLKMNGGLACSKLTSGAGTTASNTAQFRTVQPEVTQSGSGDGTGTTVGNLPGLQAVGNFAGTADLPYQVKMLDATKYAAGTVGLAGGLTNDQIKKATRGLPQTADISGVDWKKTTPTACIGPTVLFNEITNSGIGTTGVPTNFKAAQAIALCDPFGYRPLKGGSSPTAVFKNANPVPSAAATLTANTAYYTGTVSGSVAGTPLGTQKFWDPITAAQASGGAFCRDALYYGADGLGRGIPTNDPPIVAVTKNSAFTPVPLTGEAMEREIVPGGVCTGEAANNAKMEGLSAATNVKQKEMLEGQAFYACVAPSQYVLPKVNSVATTQAANAARQKKCSETITQMLKMNRATAGTSTSTATCVRSSVPGTDAATVACTGTGFSAIDYPLWMVGIGGGTTPSTYAVPNAYCYANACLENFAAVGTNATFNGVAKLSTLQSSPDMSTNPSATTGNSCGRANAACMAPPATWNGGAAIFKACTKTAGDETSCTLAEKQGQTGMLPTV